MHIFKNGSFTMEVLKPGESGFKQTFSHCDKRAEMISPKVE